MISSEIINIESECSSDRKKVSNTAWSISSINKYDFTIYIHTYQSTNLYTLLNTNTGSFKNIHLKLIVRTQTFHPFKRRFS